MVREERRWLPDIEKLQSLAILLVVFGHSRYGVVEENPGWYIVVHYYVYTFHMPLFAAVSGFLFIHGGMLKGEVSWRRLLVAKSRRLLAPYFVIISVVYLARVALTHLYPQVMHLQHDLSWLTWIKTYMDPDYSPLNYYWFLIALYWLFALFAKPMFAIVRSRNIPLIVVATVLCLLPYQRFITSDTFHFRSAFLSAIISDKFYFHSALLLAIYFWSGCLFHLIKDRVDRWNPFLALGVSATIWLILAYWSLGGGELGGFRKTALMLATFSGMMMAYSFIQVYVRGKWRFLAPIEGYSYSIYLLSWFGHRAAETAVTLALGLQGFYVLCPLSFFLATACPILVAKFVEQRLPALGFLVGASPVRSKKEGAQHGGKDGAHGPRR